MNQEGEAANSICGHLNISGKKIIVETNENLKPEDRKSSLARGMKKDVSRTVQTDDNMKDQAAKIKAIFESGSVMLWTVNRNIALTSYNERYAEAIESQYGIKPEVNKDPKKPKREFATKAYHDFWNRKYGEVFRTGESLNFQTKTTDMKGKIHYRDIHLNPIKYEISGEVKEVAGMGIDITEKKEAERNLSEQSLKIRTIFNSTNHMIWSLGTDYKLTFFNEAYEQKVLARFGIRVLLGDNVLETFNKQLDINGEKWKEIIDEVFSGKKIQFEEEVTDLRGIKHIEDISLSPILNERGQVMEITGLSQTVTFKRAAEKKLREQAAKIHAIFDSTAMLIWTVDRDYRILAYNRVFGDKHNQFLGHEVSIGSNFVEVLHDHLSEEGREDMERHFTAAFNGRKQQFEGKLQGLDGQTRWMETYFGPIYSEDGTIKEVSCISHEITDKKIIEQQMRDNIREKEVLLQEVHHRVKNNLQVISSILNLQTSFVKDSESLNILRESQNRIKSMSFIHESLYQTKDFSGIEFSDYILSLSQNLIHTYSLNKTEIIFKTDLRETKLSLDQAIPCGLIVNEIVSNALKYAFPNRDKGTVFLGIREKKGKIHLEISDDGIGMPEGIDPEDADTLGIQLIYTLIEQLDATMELKIDGGTKYLITFEKQPK